MSVFGNTSILLEKGNGTLLQYSCLENPMDGGAWWAAVHGVREESDMTEAARQQQQYLTPP